MTGGYILRPHAGWREPEKSDPTVCTLIPSGRECRVSVKSLQFQRRSLLLTFIEQVK